MSIRGGTLCLRSRRRQAVALATGGAEMGDDPQLQASMLEPWDAETMYQKVNSKGEPLGEPYHVPRVVVAPSIDNRVYILDADGELREVTEPDEEMRPLTDDQLVELVLLDPQYLRDNEQSTEV